MTRRLSKNKVDTICGVAAEHLGQVDARAVEGEALREGCGVHVGEELPGRLGCLGAELVEGEVGAEEVADLVVALRHGPGEAPA